MKIVEYDPKRAKANGPDEDDVLRFYKCVSDRRENEFVRRRLWHTIMEAASSERADEKLDAEDASWLQSVLDSTSQNKRDFVITMDGLQTMAKYLIHPSLDEEDLQLAYHIVGQINICTSLDAGFDPDAVQW
jgi:hypothetical protein